MAGRRVLLLVLAAACLAAVTAAAARAGSKPSSAVFELIYQKRPNWFEVVRNDRQRMAFICSRGRRRTAETGGTGAGADAADKHKAAPAAEAFAMPLSSGAYTGTGQYFVRFRVGTPAQPFLLVADTGSDLTWVKCRGPAPDAAYGYGAPAPSSSSTTPPPPHGRVFRPEKSRTWAPIPCSSDTCVASLPFSLAACPTPGSPCAYDYR
jgi:hypothetical protein